MVYNTKSKKNDAAEIADVEIIIEKPVVIDSFNEIPEMGCFVLEKMGHPVGGGIILQIVHVREVRLQYRQLFSHR